MNVALAHHWLTSYRGGERVLEQMAALFPDSDLYTLVRDRRIEIPGLTGHRVVPSKLGWLPGSLKAYRHLLPVHPLAIRNLRVPDHVDLLLTSDASLMKGISCSSDTTHVCYCHSPPRYLWEMADTYKKTSLAARVALDRFAPMLRRFDFDAAQKVTHFVANSHFVADRIRRYYHRESDVIYPPVSVGEFRSTQKRESYSLVISELVGYKRIDVAVDAFNQLGTPLIVIGDGPERRRLQSMAKSNIRFLGRQPFSTLKAHYEAASAFIFPGIEDFGITPVEAQAAGCPVIAFRAGGALETVVEGRTGQFFDEQSGECLAEAVQRGAAQRFEPAMCRSNAEQFSIARFRERYSGKIEEVMRQPEGKSAAAIRREAEVQRDTVKQAVA